MSPIPIYSVKKHYMIVSLDYCLSLAVTIQQRVNAVFIFWKVWVITNVLVF